ncbi:MAG TPA: tetratricopeptide repeat protein [Pyrinomonadaceae bacterium]|nr:tetratricopeptide repeat protein [Pyrinomonadaceae bacterium]
MKRSLAIKIAAVLLLLLAAVPAAAKDTWTKLKSKNFTVIGNGGQREIRKLTVNLEEFRHVLSLLFSKARIETPVPTTVFLFKNQSSFKPFKPQYKGKTKENVAGYFLSFADGNYITLTSELGYGDPHEVIFHEYEHFVVRNNVPNAPTWLDEGMAEFFSTFKTSNDDHKATLGGPIARHILTLREGKLLPLETLFTVNRRSPHYNESGKAGIFYAQSWALVQFLMLHNEGKRQPQLTKFIDGLTAGLSIEENFRQSFQTDYKTIENELRSYLGKFTFPILNVNFPKQLDFAKEVESSVMPEAEVEYYLGDLLLRGRRLDEAESHLQKSIELDANFARSQISLGILRMGQKRFPEARKLLEAAMANEPSNYLAHLHHGHVLVQEDRYEDAIKSYQHSIKLKPEVAQSHSDLGYAFLNLGRDEDGIESFKQATKLDPRNPFLYRSRSYVYLRLARGALAGSDARMYLRLQGWQDDHAAYMALALHFGLRQSKQPAPANNILTEALTRLSVSEWPYPVFRYLQRQITAPELLALSTDNDKLTEAHAYIGLDLSLSGNRDEAMPHLKWVKESGNRNFVEYNLALSEIERLDAKPD